MTHDLKIQKQFADAVLNGRKTFEVRRNDRGYNAGDLVKFTVVEQGAAFNLICGGHPLNGAVYRIGYVLSGWGLKNGFVAFSIEPYREQTTEV